MPGNRVPREKGTLLCSQVGVLGASFSVSVCLSPRLCHTHARAHTLCSAPLLRPGLAVGPGRQVACARSASLEAGSVQ